MAPTADPYRTLGLRRGASLDEVKRAYRALVKANHPDAAGEAALPRFLAIQAAYDQIVGPDGGTAPTSGAPGPTGSPRAWQADANRADATRRAYGGRARRTRTSRPGSTGATRPGAGANSSPGSTRAGDPAPGAPAGEAGTNGEPPPGRGRPPKKATLGSTSYDGADAEPFEPDWGGASWYGTTSGTYWTLNPKEYADPRKHGPEYQARARRAAADASAAADAIPVAPPTPAGSTTHTTGTWWEATDGGDPSTDPAMATPPDPPPAPPDPAPAPAYPAADPPDGTPDGTPRSDPVAWLETGSSTLVGRVGRAVVGWAPIALGIGWLVGEVSGCGRFSATCDPAAVPVTIVAQLAVLVLLLAVPRLAGAAVVASVATLAAAIPGALLLASMGGASDTTSSRTALAGLLVIGWSVGLVVGLVREVRRPPPVDRPVS